MTITALSKPLTRKLKADDGTRRRRPMFMEISPEGVITVWPRRCRKEQISIRRLYMVAVTDRVSYERAKAQAMKRAAKKGGQHG